MKRTLVLTALAAACLAANAQSSATLFGIVDASLRYTKNGDQTVYSLASGGASTSRIGFRATEDLGGGLKAGFWLESGFNVDTGTQSDATRLWNRRATVSLLGGFGELRMGRDRTPTYLGFADYDAFETAGVANADKFVSRLGTNVDTNTRADNLVAYFTPGSLGGFYAHAAVAAGEGTAGKKYYGVRAGYAAGPLNVSGSYGVTEVTPLARGEEDFRIMTLGASYDFGVAKLLAAASRTDYLDQDQTVINVGAVIPAGPGAVRVSVIDVRASGRTASGASTDANDARQLALGYLYDLSKRTSLYTTVSRIDNKGNAAYVVDGNPALPNPSRGADSTGFEVGIRHRF